MASFHYMIMIVACATVFAMMFHQGEAIKCFVCNSHNDTRCAEKPPPEDLNVDCSTTKGGSKYTFCRKIIQIIEFSVNNLPPDTRTIRGCGWEEGNYKNKCYQRSGFGGRQEVCACDKDGCNGAATVKATFGVLLAAVVVFFARA
ncbi:CLUMA_CG014265, isoform A [Clunio marinus]|uniref:CLUMA_CG014265, isoform A n=1 Tax=Clunio marinus TaxID=568069 RepID=A0A1J1ILI9_9DIPT|nr:CLUMA_CG014265, isoform A [Clunio marinus]